MLDIIRRKSQSFGVKIIFALIIVVFVFWGASTMQSPTAGVLARVNGEDISQRNFAEQYTLFLNRARSAPEYAQLDADGREELARQQLDSMILSEIVRQEAEKLGMGVSDIELAALIKRAPDFKGADGKFSQELYQSMIAQMGMNPGSYERLLTQDMTFSRLQAYIALAAAITPEEARQSFNFAYERRGVQYIYFPAGEFAAGITPDEAAVAAYYQENQSRFTAPDRADFEHLLFDVKSLAAGLDFDEAELRSYYEANQGRYAEPAAFHARHILFSAPFSGEGSEAAAAEAKARADQVLAELKAGKDFAGLALKYSGDDATKSGGGDLGWFGPGRMEPAFEEAVAALEPGKYSEPVRTYFGYHLIELLEKRDERTQSFDEVRDGVLGEMREEKAYLALDTAMAEVEDLIAAGRDLAQIGERYGLLPKSTGFMDVAELPDLLGAPRNTFAGIASVAPGSILPLPVEVKDGFMVMRLNRFEAANVAPLDAARPEIVAALSAGESHRLALEAATAAAAEIKESGRLPDKYSSRLKSAVSVNRFNGIVELGFAPLLNQAVFSADKDVWTGGAFSTENGAAVIRVTDIGAPSDSEWEQIGDAFTAQAGNARQSALYNSYLNELRARSEVEILYSGNLLPR